jgi:hypothetical protein
VQGRASPRTTASLDVLETSESKLAAAPERAAAFFFLTFRELEKDF